MALKVLMTKVEFEALPDVLKEHYTEENGDYVLDSDDSSLTAKVSEFRTNNIKLIEERKELETKLKAYDGVDPDKYAELLAQQRELEDKELIEAGKLDELVEKRTERMKADYDGQTRKLQETLTEAQEELTATKSQLAKVVIDGEVTTAVSRVGALRKGAMTDVLSRARQTFILEDGHPVPKGPDGSILYGTDGKNPLTIDEWAQGLTDEAPFLFEASAGSGAKGGDGDDKPPPSGTVNADDKEAFGQNLEDIATGKVKVNVA